MILTTYKTDAPPGDAEAVENVGATRHAHITGPANADLTA